MKFFKSFEDYLQSIGGYSTIRLYGLNEYVSPEHTRVRQIMDLHKSSNTFPIPNVIRFYVPRSFRTDVLTQLARLTPVRDQKGISRELNCIQDENVFLIDVENIHFPDVLKIQSEIWDFLAKKQPKTECIYILHLNNMYQSWSEEERFVFQNTFGFSLQYMGGENFDSFLMVKAWSIWGMEVGKEALQNLKKSGKLPSELKRDEYNAILSKFPKEDSELDSSEDKVESVVDAAKLPEPKVMENTYERRWNISSNNYKPLEANAPKSFYPTLIKSKPEVPKKENTEEKGSNTEPEMTPVPIVHRTVDTETIPRDYRGRMESGESKDQLIFVTGNHGVLTPSELNECTEDIIAEVVEQHKLHNDRRTFNRDNYQRDSSDDESYGISSCRMNVQELAARLQEGDSSVASCFEVASSGREDLTTSEDETDKEEVEQKFGSVESVASTLKGKESVQKSIVAEYANLPETELLEKFKENKDWDWINIWRAAHFQEDMTEFDAWREEAIEKHFLSLLSEEQLGTFTALMSSPLVIEFVYGLNEEQQRVYDQCKNKPIPTLPSFVPELKLTPQQENIILPVIREKRFIVMDNFMKYYLKYENLYYLWKKAINAPRAVTTNECLLEIAEQELDSFGATEVLSEGIAMIVLPAEVKEPLLEKDTLTKDSTVDGSENSNIGDDVTAPCSEETPNIDIVHAQESRQPKTEISSENEEPAFTSHRELSEPVSEISAMTHLPRPVEETFEENVLSACLLISASAPQNLTGEEDDVSYEPNNQNSNARDSEQTENKAEDSLGNEDQTSSILPENLLSFHEPEIEHAVDALSLLSKQSSTESEPILSVQVENKDDSLLPTLEDPVENALEVHADGSGEELNDSVVDLSNQITAIHNVTEASKTNILQTKENAYGTVAEVNAGEHIGNASQPETESSEKTENPKDFTDDSVVIDHEAEKTNESSLKGMLEVETPKPEEIAPELPVLPTKTEVSPKPVEKPRGPATWTSALLNAMLDEPLSEPSSIVSTDEHDLSQNLASTISTVVAIPALATSSKSITEPSEVVENVIDNTEEHLDAELLKTTKIDTTENKNQTSNKLNNDNATEVTNSATSLETELTITDNYQQKNEYPSSENCLSHIGEDCAKLEEFQRTFYNSSESSLHSTGTYLKPNEPEDETRTPTPNSLDDYEQVTSLDFEEDKEDNKNC